MKSALAMIVAITAFLGTLPANAQLVRCADRVYRDARDCPGARKSSAVTNLDTRPAPSAPAAVPSPYQGENPSQYMARWKVYCVGQPPAQRAECKVQAEAQTQLYSANYWAAFYAEMQRRTEETLRKSREAPQTAPAIRAPAGNDCNRGPGTPRC